MNAITYNWSKLAQNGITAEQKDLIIQYLGNSPTKLIAGKKFRSPREIYDSLFSSAVYPQHHNPATTLIPQSERTQLLNAIILLSYYCSVNKEMYEPGPDSDMELLIMEKTDSIIELKKAFSVNDVMANALFNAGYRSLNDLNDKVGNSISFKSIDDIYTNIINNNILSVSEAADIYRRLFCMLGYYQRTGVIEVGPGIVTVPPR